MDETTHISISSREAPASGSPSPTTSHSTPPTIHSSAAPEDDDIWGTPSHSPTSTGPSLQSHIQSDVPRLRTTHTTAGYRDGIATAREAAVQPGFDEGYLLGAAVGVRAGYLIGVLEGLVTGVSDSKDASDSPEARSQREGLRTQLDAIRADLKVEKLLNRDWIEEDGTWKWEVGAKVQDPTIATVANAHPVLQKWSQRVQGLMQLADVQRGDGMKARDSQE